ncbi:hypothetical protein HYPSUDRAFT_204394 [Hypholoma sublateritium FD-334 SS-4]|uniref:Uncharacterized protein n=1 Tax=Hypholoma sublateritium (strain FD-334 SS-4) TaxID=945553 RepID=A0A0D2KYX2_HYPSF|nr:hypothetical protein HYPSUDRAFT_204394 [Hypholoma sublateritium FD-334 SS-4]
MLCVTARPSPTASLSHHLFPARHGDKASRIAVLAVTPVLFALECAECEPNDMKPSTQPTRRRYPSREMICSRGAPPLNVQRQCSAAAMAESSRPPQGPSVMLPPLLARSRALVLLPLHSFVSFPSQLHCNTM